MKIWKKYFENYEVQTSTVKATLGLSSRTIFRAILTGSSQDTVESGCTQVSKKKYFLEGASFTLLKMFLFGVNPVKPPTWQHLVKTSQGVGRGGVWRTAWKQLHLQKHVGCKEQTERNMGELQHIPAVSFPLVIWLHYFRAPS